MKILKPEDIDFNRLSTIIFDWGGVITNIEFQATVRAFQQLGHQDFMKYLNHDYQDNIFLKLETGFADISEFHTLMIREIGNHVSVGDINNAFCAMLLDTPVQRITLLKNLRLHFKIFLLSNTNAIHTQFFLSNYKNNTGADFTALFDNVYYSFNLGLRKPDRAIFEYVLSDIDAKPEQILFLDDSMPNILTAESMNLQVFQITPEYPVEKIFSQWMY